MPDTPGDTPALDSPDILASKLRQAPVGPNREKATNHLITAGLHTNEQFVKECIVSLDQGAATVNWAAVDKFIERRTADKTLGSRDLWNLIRASQLAEGETDPTDEEGGQ